MIILPEHEQILDFVCGDKDFWVVSGAQNLAYVKPAKAGATTNLNLVTASGNVYSFLLTEGAARGRSEALCRARRHRCKAASSGAAKFYTAAEVDELRQAAETRARRRAGGTRRRREDHRGARQQRSRRPTRRSSIPVSLQGRTRSRSSSTAIYTTARSRTSRRTPANCRRCTKCRTARRISINFQVEHGVYVVAEVLDSGYLSIGQQKLAFERGEVRRPSWRPIQRHQRRRHARFRTIAQTPRGVLPRQLQMWLMVGLAVVILAHHL